MVAIKKFQMPNNCCACPFRLEWCTQRIYMIDRPKACPLIELPEDCYTCKHYGKTADRDYCVGCMDANKWEPMEKREEEA